jgi:hypothetical protein
MTAAALANGEAAAGPACTNVECPEAATGRARKAPITAYRAASAVDVPRVTGVFRHLSTRL